MPNQHIVCAAIKFDDGLIIASPRHCDTFMWATVLKIPGRKSEVLNAPQGFIDQYGTFLTREEARIIATANGQLRPDASQGDELFSEDLY